MHVNSFRYGHDVLKWRLRGNESDVYSMKLKDSMVTLTTIKKHGVYEFWTENADESSAKVQIFMRLDTPNEIVDKIVDYAELSLDAKWQQDIVLYAKHAFADNPEKPFVEHLKTLMNGTKDLQKYETDFYFALIHMAERYVNALNITMNGWHGARPSLIYGGQFELKMQQQTSEMRVYEVEESQKKYLYVKHIDINPEPELVMLNASEDTLIQVIPIAFNGKDWLNVFYHYQFNEDYSAQLWKKACTETDKIEQVMLNDAELSTLKTTLSDDEKKNWKLEQAKNPYDYIFSRPVILSADHETYITVAIPDYDFMVETGENFYLSIREEDLLFREDFDYLVPITGPIIQVDRGAKNIDGNVFFYIQAKDGKIVSRVTRYDFTNEEMNYYKEDVRLAYFELYERQLCNMVRYYVPSAEIYIKDTLARFRTMSDVDIDCIFQYLFTEIPRSYKDKETIDKLMFVILEDWNSHFNVNSDFFGEQIKYSYAKDVFYFPPESESCKYLLCIGTVSYDGAEFKPVMKYYHSKPETIDIPFRTSHYYFMYAINLENFHRSGFFFIDTHNKIDPIIYRSRIYYERV